MDELRAPTARSPLAGREADLARISAAEVPFLTQVDGRCSEGAAARLGFPVEPNTVTGDMARGVLWLGPDEWLVVAGPGAAPELVAELSEALVGEHHSVVDVSANRTVIELRGPGRHELLATGCSVDLDPAGGWGPGRCAQTMFGTVPVLLQELDGVTRIFVRPSFAHPVLDQLLAGAAILPLA
ncbi:MAG: sarcosine oxidase subunit gamma [Actinomycetota bacterium]